MSVKQTYDVSSLWLGDSNLNGRDLPFIEGTVFSNYCIFGEPSLGIFDSFTYPNAKVQSWYREPFIGKGKVWNGDHIKINYMAPFHVLAAMAGIKSLPDRVMSEEIEDLAASLQRNFTDFCIETSNINGQEDWSILGLITPIKSKQPFMIDPTNNNIAGNHTLAPLRPTGNSGVMRVSDGLLAVVRTLGQQEITEFEGIPITYAVKAPVDRYEVKPDVTHAFSASQYKAGYVKHLLNTGKAKASISEL